MCPDYIIFENYEHSAIFVTYIKVISDSVFLG